MLSVVVQGVVNEVKVDSFNFPSYYPISKVLENNKERKKMDISMLRLEKVKFTALLMTSDVGAVF